MAALLLGASLFFIGCGDDEVGGAVPHWYDGLGNANEAASTVTVSVSQDLTASLAVPANWTLAIVSPATLTVKPGVTLTVTAGAHLSGTGNLVGADATSKVKLGAGVTAAVGSQTLDAETTYVWYGAWLDEDDYETAEAAAADLVETFFTVDKARADGPVVTLLSDVAVDSDTLAIPSNVTLTVPSPRTLRSEYPHGSGYD
jgi:hypothetical protein